MFPMGNLSFQASQPIRLSKDMSVSIDTIKHFWGKIGEVQLQEARKSTWKYNFIRIIYARGHGGCDGM